MTLGFSQQINGKPNFFIEKIWAGLLDQYKHLRIGDYAKYQEEHKQKFGVDFPDYQGVFISPKLHTIRHDSHNRWKPGMNIHMVVNNRSKNRFQFAPEMKCVSVQEIRIEHIDTGIGVMRVVKIDGFTLGQRDKKRLAINDGFDSVDDFFRYFNKDFTGKIIHWTDLQY